MLEFKPDGERMPTMKLPFKGLQDVDELPLPKNVKVPEPASSNINSLPEKGSPASNYRYATPSKTNDAANWLATDGPTSENELYDLCEAIVDRKAVGDYCAKDVETNWDGRITTRISIKGPYRSLVIVPKWLDELTRALKRIKDMNSYRKSRPSLEKSSSKRKLD